MTAFHPTQSPISGDVSPAPGTTTQSMGVMAFDWQKGNDKDNPRPSTMNVQTEATNTLSATRVPAVLAFNPVATVAGGGVTHALTRSQKGATEGGTGRGTPIVVMASGQANAEIREDGAPTLTQLHEAPIVAVGRARRLMPVETERLMDWDDGHTAIGIDERGREYRLADGPRYKLCGNGVGSVCAEWIARRLVALDAALAKSPSTERAA